MQVFGIFQPKPTQPVIVRDFKQSQEIVNTKAWLDERLVIQLRSIAVTPVIVVKPCEIKYAQPNNETRDWIGIITIKMFRWIEYLID